MDKASPTEAAEETGSGELEENFRTIISSIYSQMEYELSRKFIRFYCTTLLLFLFK